MELRRMFTACTLFCEAFCVFALSYLCFRVTSQVLDKYLGFWGSLLSWFLYGIYCTVIAYTIRKKKNQWTLQDLGFKIHRSWKQDIWYGIVAFGILYLVQIPFSMALIHTHADLLVKQFGLQNEQSVFSILVKFSVMAFTIGFITGSFHEEIRFRGFLQGLFTRESLPSIGFFISLIPFALNHYFSHPEWTMLQTLNTFPGGIVLCLAYYATGSLIVVMTVHTLINFVPIYVPLIYACGYPLIAYFILFAFSVVFVVILILGKAEVWHLLVKTGELFTVSGAMASLAGLLMGTAFLYMYHELSLIQSRLELGNIGYYLIVLVISAIFLIASFSVKRIRKGKNMIKQPDGNPLFIED